MSKQIKTQLKKYIRGNEPATDDKFMIMVDQREPLGLRTKTNKTKQEQTKTDKQLPLKGKILGETTYCPLKW